MPLLLPGELIPGAVGVLEQQKDTVQITGSGTTGTVTFNLDGSFDAVPTVATSAGISALSGASASTDVDETVDTDGSSADQVVVEVTLDTAPGTGESTTVTVGMLASEGGD